MGAIIRFPAGLLQTRVEIESLSAFPVRSPRILEILTFLNLAKKPARDLKHSSILKEAGSSQKNSANSLADFSNSSIPSFRTESSLEAYWKEKENVYCERKQTQIKWNWIQDASIKHQCADLDLTGQKYLIRLRGGG